MSDDFVKIMSENFSVREARQFEEWLSDNDLFDWSIEYWDWPEKGANND